MATISILLLSSLKAVILILVAAGVTMACRRGPARLRAVVWATALAGCLALPVVAPLLPSWNLPLPFEIGLLEPQEFAAPPAGTAAAVAPIQGHESVSPPRLSLPSVAQDHPFGLSLRWLVVGLWAVGVLLATAHFGLGLWRASRAARRAAIEDDPHWGEYLHEAVSRAGVRRQVGLRRSAEVEVPATLGLLRPVILLPDHARCWTEERRRAVLLHEMIHIKRFDWAVRMMARTVRAAYWFNPLSWWAVRRLDLEQELACDEEVLALGTPAGAYACHLLGIAMAVRRSVPAIATIAMARTPNLEKRIMRILKKSPHTRIGLALLLPAVLMVALMVPALAVVSPGPPEPLEAGEELKQVLIEMRETEEKLKPELEQIEALEVEFEPTLEEIEEIEGQIDHAAIAEIEENLAPYIERIKEIEIDMAPLNEQLGTLESELDKLQIHIEDGTLAEVQRQIHEQVEKHTAAFEMTRRMMEPYLHRIEEVHIEMEEVHRHMEKVHRNMESHQRIAERLHEKMAPFHEKMAEMQHKMEPFHREMERLGERFHRALEREVAGILRHSFLGLVGPGAPIDEAAQRIVEMSDVRVDDDIIRLRVRPRRTETVLKDLLQSHRVGVDDAFDAAVEQASQALDQLEIHAP